MPLTADQQDELRELVTPPAWAFYSALPDDQKINLDVRLRMVGGDLNQLAAAVLRTAAQVASRQAAEGGGGVKKFKDGAEEIEYFQGQVAEALDAELWLRLAGQLEGLAAGSGLPAPVFTEWI